MYLRVSQCILAISNSSYGSTRVSTLWSGIGLSLSRGASSNGSCCQAVPHANYNKTTITKQFYYILDFLSRAAQQTKPARNLRLCQVVANPARRSSRAKVASVEFACRWRQAKRERRVWRTYGKCLDKTIKSNTLKQQHPEGANISDLNLSLSQLMSSSMFVWGVSICQHYHLPCRLAAKINDSRHGSTWTMVSAWALSRHN